MSKLIQSSRRSQSYSHHLPVAPAELRRLRTRLHTSEHVVLNQQEAHTVLQLVDLLTPAEPVAPPARRSKQPYLRQQHRPVRKNRRQ